QLEEQASRQISS
nr:Chain P, Kinesin-like protein KIF2C [Homo sapiens]